MPKKINTLSDLVHDPKNARKHTPRNVEAIVDSLNKVGPARSVVIDEDGVILAGNATVDAAGEAGIEKIQVVRTDGQTLVAVQRVGLTAKQKAQLAIADNRSAELAEWNPDTLADLAAEFELDLTDEGFTADEIPGLSQELELDDAGAGEQAIGEKYEVVVECDDEAHQREVFEKLSGGGYRVRVLTI